MSGLFQDLRHALRQMTRSPGFTLVAVITLAPGIGANTAVFSVIDAVMLRPLPCYQPERLIAAESVNTRAPGFGALSYPDFFDNGKPEGPPWREIVGVVGNVRLSMTQREMQPAMYVPASQLNAWCCMHTVVRSTVDPISLEQSIRQIVASMDKEIPVTQFRTLHELMATELSQPRFTMVLLGSFAGLAITLTIVGLYGVMTYSVTRRTREIGVRMALGAQRGVVLTMVLRDAAVLLAFGIVIGIVAVLTSASVLQSMLYGTGSRDPIVLMLVCVGVSFVGLVAAYIPAIRAARIVPMVALRYE
jgi:putative ABC transport system permease protein